jgi:hypothetical protein
MKYLKIAWDVLLSRQTARSGWDVWNASSGREATAGPPMLLEIEPS